LKGGNKFRDLGGGKFVYRIGFRGRVGKVREIVTCRDNGLKDGFFGFEDISNESGSSDQIDLANSKAAEQNGESGLFPGEVAKILADHESEGTAENVVDAGESGMSDNG